MSGFDFYSHVNFSVTKIKDKYEIKTETFYSHVNFSVTKMWYAVRIKIKTFTVT